MSKPQLGIHIRIVLHAISILTNILGIRMRIMCLTQNTWKFDRTKWRRSKRCQDDTVLSSAYPAHGSASEVNRLGADVQVVSCRRYLVVFCAVNRLHISGLSHEYLRLTYPCSLQPERQVVPRSRLPETLDTYVASPIKQTYEVGFRIKCLATSTLCSHYILVRLPESLSGSLSF